MMNHISKPNQQISFVNKFMIFLSLVAMVIFSGCAQTSGVMWPSAAMANSINPGLTEKMGANLVTAAENDELNSYKTTLSDQVLATAYSQMGKKYRYGGTSPETGFDCAGFVQWVYKQNGYKLPRTSREHLHVGKEVEREELLPGDILVYYRGRGRRGTHVGIYTGNGKFIHSPHTGDYVREAKAFDRYRSARFIKAVRVLNDQDIRPLTPEQKEILKQAARSGKFKAGENPPYRAGKGDSLAAVIQKSGRFANGPKAKKKGENPITEIGRQLTAPPPDSNARHASASFSQDDRQIENSSKITTKKSSQTKYYKIVRGDTLSTIAHKNGVSLKDLKAANGVSSKTVLKIGQKLKIPGQIEDTPSTAKAAPKEPSAVKAETASNKVKRKQLGSSYTVKKGDTISDIAQGNDIAIKELMAANNLSGNHTLRIGQKLILPGKGITVSEKANTRKNESPQQVRIARVYKVKKGDTISNIAQRSGVSTQTLLKVNDLDKNHTLRIGQQIAIP